MVYIIQCIQSLCMKQSTWLRINELSTLETEVYVWHYALLVVLAREEEIYYSIIVKTCMVILFILLQPEPM